MPFSRPTLTDLRTQAEQDVTSSIGAVGTLLRKTILKALAWAQAGLAHLHYGYLDWIAKQSVPWSATDENLVGWAALKNVTLKDAVKATGAVTFQGTAGKSILSGASLARDDGATFTTTADATVGSDGTAVVQATADVAGTDGNTDVGATMTLVSPVEGILANGAVTTAFTGGVDVEDPEAFRGRMLQVYQNPPQGGAQSDYVTWAEDVPGVTRAWCRPNGWGIGTVVVYVMLDDVNAAHGGIPQGTNGVAAAEPRGAAATGDQLTVANYVYPLQPVGALVYVFAPVANVVPFTIYGFSAASDATKSAVSAAISAVFAAKGDLGGTVYISDLETAIAAAAGTQAFGITSPASDIASAANAVPVLGAITWS